MEFFFPSHKTWVGWSLVDTRLCLNGWPNSQILQDFQPNLVRIAKYALTDIFKLIRSSKASDKKDQGNVQNNQKKKYEPSEYICSMALKSIT